MALKYKKRIEGYVGRSNRMIGGVEVGIEEVVCIAVGDRWFNLTNKQALKIAKHLKKCVKMVKKQDEMTD